MFVYSPRRGTPAAHWEQVAPDVQRERFARLVAVTDAHVRGYHDRKIGTTVRALVHGASRKDPTRLAAKTTDNVTVHFPLIESAPEPRRTVDRRPGRSRGGVGRLGHRDRPGERLERAGAAAGRAGHRSGRDAVDRT